MNDYNELIEAYKEIYYANEGDFNVLNAVHLGENDHTNILCGILNLKVDNGKPFMTSFVKEVLGITYIDNYDSLMALTQISAIGSKEDSHGYIDLLIKDKDNKVFIVIENKVCDATDMPHQLDRYYFTFVQNNELLKKYYDIEFQAKCNSYWTSSNNKINQNSNIYIVYLTKDGTKEPSEESINNELKAYLEDKYKKISYREISDWLNSIKTKSLTNNSIELYRLALNKFLTTKEDKNNAYLENEAIQSFIKEKVFKGKNLSLVYQYINLKNTYDKLNDLKKKLDKDSESDLVLNDLVDCVECYRDNVFGQFAPDNWMVYCSSQSITFFPSHWYANYKGSKNSCIHFMVYKWKSKNYQLNLNIHGNACKKYIIDKDQDFYNQLRQNLLIDSFASDEEDQFPESLEETKSKFISSKNEWHVAYNMQNIVKEINAEWNPNNVEVFFKNFVDCDEIQKIVKWIDNNLN